MAFNVWATLGGLAAALGITSTPLKTRRLELREAAAAELSELPRENRS